MSIYALEGLCDFQAGPAGTAIAASVESLYMWRASFLASSSDEGPDHRLKKLVDVGTDQLAGKRPGDQRHFAEPKDLLESGRASAGGAANSP